MFEWILGVERGDKESFFLAGVRLRVIGRRAGVGECRIPKMNAWNCVHSREVHHAARSLYSNYCWGSNAFSVLGDKSGHSVQNLPCGINRFLRPLPRAMTTWVCHPVSSD